MLNLVQIGLGFIPRDQNTAFYLLICPFKFTVFMFDEDGVVCPMGFRVLMKFHQSTSPRPGYLGGGHPIICG